MAIQCEDSTVRDRLWLWGHDAGSHNNAGVCHGRHGSPQPAHGEVGELRVELAFDVVINLDIYWKIET